MHPCPLLSKSRGTTTFSYSSAILQTCANAYALTYDHSVPPSLIHMMYNQMIKCWSSYLQLGESSGYKNGVRCHFGILHTRTMNAYLVFHL